MAVGLGEGQGAAAFIDCKDVEDPNEKRKWRITTVVGRDAKSDSDGRNTPREGKDYTGVLKGHLVWPANLISSSVDTGYQSEVASKFKSGVVLTNLHSDIRTRK